MRKTMYCATAMVLVLAAGAVQSDEKADTRAIIEKAIQARGGAEKLATIKATTFKLKGKFYGMGAGLDYTGEFAIQPPDKTRMQLEIDANGMKIAFLRVVNGGKGFRKIADMASMDLEKDELAEAAEEMYVGGVESLVPLVKDKAFELSTLGEVKVGDEPAVGVRVSHKGHGDVNLFFDKKTGLLVKSERTVKDLMAGGKEVTQETLHTDYKEIGGVKHAMKMVIKRDGKDYLDGEMSDFETPDKLDDSLFGKP
jgi:hypothetical protein